jgi:hypothetical protein
MKHCKCKDASHISHKGLGCMQRHSLRGDFCPSCKLAIKKNAEIDSMLWPSRHDSVYLLADLDAKGTTVWQSAKGHRLVYPAVSV